MGFISLCVHDVCNCQCLRKRFLSAILIGTFFIIIILFCDVFQCSLNWMAQLLMLHHGGMKFSISKTWDNLPTDHGLIDIILYPKEDFIVMEINAPYFNSPEAPKGEKGKPFPNLWDYEVVEAFFLGRDEKYLEVEFSPHGQHLLLLLSGRKNAIKMCLPVDYSASIDRDSWKGIANIPKSYFPPHVNLFNAYAIHGSNENRVYEALFPVQNGHFENPDFHRLEFFKFVDFTGFFPENHHLSEVWLDALKSSSEGEELVCSKTK